MQYVNIIIAVCAVLVLLKIFAAFKFGQSIYECYVVAYLPLAIVVTLGCIKPEWRGNEDFWLFLVYIPVFALYILPFTMVPVIIAHIVHKIKFRNQPNKNERVKKTIADVVVASFFIGGLVIVFAGFFIGALSFIGVLFTTGACIYMIIRFIKRIIVGRGK